MGDRSKIEWTDATWNPWYGCTKVSPGCAHCYMFREQRTYGRNPEVVTRSKTRFNDPLKWAEPRTIFTCSWSDFFHEAADPWRDEAWEIIRRTPQHRYLILTKRPERMADRLPWWPPTARAETNGDLQGWRNIWFGVSVENRRWEERVFSLLAAAALHHDQFFVSAEPLLEDVEIPWLGEAAGISWVIAGGESGPGARPFDVAWARRLREDCRTAGAAFFLKQLGAVPMMAEAEWRALERMPLLAARNRDRVWPGFVPLAMSDPKGGEMDEWPADLRVREFPWPSS